MQFFGQQNTDHKIEDPRLVKVEERRTKTLRHSPLSKVKKDKCDSQKQSLTDKYLS